MTQKLVILNRNLLIIIIKNILLLQRTKNKKITANKSKNLLVEHDLNKPDKTIKPPVTSDNSFSPLTDFRGNKMRLKFNRSILRQSKVSYTHGNVVNIYIVYELAGSSFHFDDPTLKSCLFCAATLTKNAYIDKYQYSGYGIGFDRKLTFSFPGGEFGQNGIIFGADMSSSAHVNNRETYFSSWKRSNTRITTYSDRRKNVFS